MDGQALETEALAAIAAAATPDEVEEARVRYLGRKSELKLALREVRDRETGNRAECGAGDDRAGLRRA